MTEDQIKAMERRIADLEAQVAGLAKALPKDRNFILGVARGLHDAGPR